ncbi:hypothetical protein COY29_05020 [Candidatus Woesebacteria bacterium CG_4_10_14_0_2_um_filter_39_14]|uniref:Nucleoside 2-deoxyribosyltransferase n=1 Tax=Candidatus Woesebacteria bacterium CG_4_10_14_0_2_um_filter_39_14 TaxID=1975054 RepID=A0A2M7TKT1_9BACT|nr:hypothetical protein [Candidatus Parcubacteria bacterium]PIZ47558.1 MAG: hypothetical protein COY29_05020 [Candidatus Woesebacteria bacterium CG_4_10_14_0_2_um_filter_39_14]
MVNKNKEKLSVYFSAPSAFCSNKILLNKIVKSIESAGGKIILKWFEDKTKLSPRSLFKEATEAIKSADIMVAEITYPSTGVGQQIAFALSWKIPVIAIYKKGANNPSRFTIGTPSELLSVVEYNENNLKTILVENFNNFSKKEFEKFNFISTGEINDYLKKTSLSFGLSKSQLLRKIVLDWIKNHQSK